MCHPVFGIAATMMEVVSKIGDARQEEADSIQRAEEKYKKELLLQERREYEAQEKQAERQRQMQYKSSLLRVQMGRSGLQFNNSRAFPKGSMRNNRDIARYDILRMRPHMKDISSSVNHLRALTPMMRQWKPLKSMLRDD